ncbi:hypothetical protein E2P81_ATG00752 [Venturia nashicola]|nr:hypothetical protein E2P81_ATG00752 [Venturia nashicola]
MTHAVTEFPYPIVTGGGYPTHTPKGPYPSGTSVPAAAVIGKGAQHLELWPSDWDSHKSHPHLSSTQVGAIAPTGTSDKDEVYVEKPGEATIATGNKPNSPVQKATETGNQYNSAPSEIDEGPENSVEQNIDDALEPLRDLHEDLVSCDSPECKASVLANPVVGTASGEGTGYAMPSGPVMPHLLVMRCHQAEATLMSRLALPNRPPS